MVYFVCNLVDDPWIPLDSSQGEVGEHSLQVALLESHRFTGTAFPRPTLFPAVLRQVLLPVLLDSIGSPRTSQEWAAWFSRGGFDASQRQAIADYLGKHRDLFDLFSEHYPFAQVAGLESPTKETKGSALLVPSIATGNNVPLFSVLTEADTLFLRPAEAVWWLLYTHCWDTAAIKTGAAGDPRVKNGKTTGNPTGPLGQMGVVVPTGATLFETLMLNLPPRTPVRGSGDRPQWRAHHFQQQDRTEGIASPRSPQWSIRPELGLMDLLTWQARRIRLVPQQTPDGVRVTKVVLCAGDRLSRLPETEPHTAWTWVAKPRKGQSSWRPRRHRSGRAVWQGLESLLAVNLPEGDALSGDREVTSEMLRHILSLQTDEALPDTYPLRITAVGVVYGNQSAVVEDVIADEIPLPLTALSSDDRTRDLVTELVEQADALSQALNRMHADLRKAGGGDPVPWDKGHHPGAGLLHALDPLARRALAQIQRHADDDEHLEQLMQAWEQKAWEVSDQYARRLLDASPPQAFAGREIDKRLYSETSARGHFYAALRKHLTRYESPKNRSREGN
ncbi:type I-E CRISPR-associated protein Cse1/CasA [Nocardiopsis alba]|uniref:type I-E CRISPR-associated protein Cse1/CasA n=1 Tax=Nocardiopsis alba TaxID=53437 RepID=UPI0036A6D6D4